MYPLKTLAFRSWTALDIEVENMTLTEPESIGFLGVKINNIGYREIREKIISAKTQKAYVCLTDVGNVIAATRDREFFQAINHALISIPDGTPLAWYGRLLGCKKIERVSGLDLFRGLVEEENDIKHFLLGDTENTIARVIDKARKANRTLRMTGFSPPFKEAFDEDDNRKIINRIKEEDPDLIWVSLGGGRQDKWMNRCVDSLERGVMIGIGAAFKFYLGDIKTPPRIIQRMGLQWFTRLIQSPIKTGRRHVATFPKFILYFPREFMKNRKKLRDSP